MEVNDLRDRTIRDFGDQWSTYPGNEGWYGSRELFADIVSPLLDADELKGAAVAEVGSGAGRIVRMLLQAGAKHVLAIEPSTSAVESLRRNVRGIDGADRVSVVNSGGESWEPPGELDYVLCIGVIHHIPEPEPVIGMAWKALKPGGRLFIWLYGYEGNELYLKLVEPVRKISTRVPHLVLRAIVEVMYAMLVVYRYAGRIVPLPMRDYIERVLWPMSPDKRRLVIYDQLNPAYAKYYTREEALSLLMNAGFVDVRIHHRHGYSWSVVGTKPKPQGTPSE